MPAATRLTHLTIVMATLAVAAQVTISGGFGFPGGSPAGVEAGAASEPSGASGATVDGDPAPRHTPLLLVPPAACLASYEGDTGPEGPTFHDHGAEFEGQGPDLEYHDLDPNYHGPEYDPHEPALDGYGPAGEAPGSSPCDGAGTGAGIDRAPPGSVILEPWLPMPGASRPSHNVRARV
jgi:hypothetical protein